MRKVFLPIRLVKGYKQDRDQNPDPRTPKVYVPVLGEHSDALIDLDCVSSVEAKRDFHREEFTRIVMQTGDTYYCIIMFPQFIDRFFKGCNEPYQRGE